STDGQVASGKLTQMTFQQPGAYILTLRVTAENGLDSTAQQTVVVKETPPPVAVATASPSEGVAPLNVNLLGNKSEGDIEDYEWNISKGGTLYGRRTSVLFEEAGEYIITLTVTDQSGRESTAAIKVIVKPKPSSVEDKEPDSFSLTKAVADITPHQICPGGKITLNGKGSKGDIDEYKWKVETADSVLVAVLYKELTHLVLDEPGVYLITLTVFGEEGDSDNDAMVVTVIDDEHCNDIPPTFPIISPINHTFLGTSSPNNQIIKPNDPNFDELWALDNSSQPGADIGATKAWGITTGEPIVCAVIDSGVDGNHPDLKDNMVPGWNFIDNNADTSDNCGHGTQVAGIIAAAGNNGIGVTGVNWSAKIMPLVVAEYKPKPNSYLPECLASDDAIIAALNYAKEQGVKCINISLGGSSSYNPKLFDAIKANNQALIIAAAGNDFGEDNDLIPYYPASYELDNILSVCATDRKDQLVPISNVGKKSVDLCAPGSGIISTYPEQKYAESAGTSFSTAYVSGAASLLWSAFPNLSPIEIKKHLIASADYVQQLQRKERRSDGSSKVVLSVGRLNVYQVLLRVQSEQQTFTISNTGEGNLQIGEIGLSGSHASAFQILSDSCSKQQFAPSQTCSVEVLLASTKAGEKQAILEVPSNASKTATAQLSAVVKDDSNDKQLASIDLPTLNRAEPSVFHFENNELYMPSLAIPNDKGQVDVFQVKFCPVEGKPDLRFALCDAALVDDRQYPILGDSTIDMTTGIIKIPGVELGADSGLFYVVELRAVLNAQGDLEFEVVKAIQVH
ncbi:MAG: S8 family serine peptidase, partial [Candidatus Parabeggiatoa sp.]|nr:S8 family serine peptidase [Candidatus Parabeggiatoa sp.]